MNLIVLLALGLFISIKFSLTSNSVSLIENEQFKSDSARRATISGFNTITQDNLLYIAKFLSIPQRNLGMVNKYFLHVFKEVMPFHLFVSEFFKIPELRLAQRDDDLVWFADYYECYTHDPDYFFIRLIHALFHENKFSANVKLLCQYFINNYESRLLTESILNSNSDFKHYVLEIGMHSYNMNYFPDRIILIFLGQLNMRNKFNWFDESFSFRPLISNSDEGIDSFLSLFRIQNIHNQIIMLSTIIGSEKFEFVLFKALELIQNFETKIYIFKKTLLDSFYQDNYRKFSFVQDFGADEIFKQILQIIGRGHSENLVQLEDFKLLNILNEIYFGPEENISSSNLSFLYQHECREYLSNCAIHFNKMRVFSFLLDQSQFFDQIKYNLYLFRGNLPFFFKFTEKYPDWNFNEPFHNRYLFEEILKFYNIVNFVKNHSNSFTGVLELKIEFRDNLMTGFPLTYYYNYDYINIDEIYDLEFFLKNFSGSSEKSLVELINMTVEWRKNDDVDDELHLSLSDIAIQLILSSETLKSHICNLGLVTFLYSEQLIRLFRKLANPIQDLQSISTYIAIDNFDNFEYLDFINLESLTRLKILNFINEFIPIDSDIDFGIFDFIKVRKALIYLLNSDKKKDLLEIHPKILEFFEKENPKAVALLKK